jgi:uncharacterized Tic20 family protein
MEQYNQDFKRVDNNLLVATHLCQLLTYVSGFGGLVVPLVLWLTQKDKVASMDIQGKQIVNFQLSIIVYYILSIPLILFFGLGLFVLFVVGTLGLILPIVNAVKVSNHQQPVYFMNITFIK